MSSTNPSDPTRDGTPPEPAADATPEQLEADVAATRERLASSVDALTSKLDVKAQTKQKAQQASDKVKVGAQEAS
jgi:hypothetical protein